MWDVGLCYKGIEMTFFFFSQGKMMDMEKCVTRDRNSKKQNGKNISRG